MNDTRGDPCKRATALALLTMRVTGFHDVAQIVALVKHLLEACVSTGRLDPLHYTQLLLWLDRPDVKRLLA